MYAGHETRGPSKRFVMSAAKEIVIVEHSEEHSLKASKEAGSNGSGDASGTRAAGTDGPPAVRRRLPDERHSLTITSRWAGRKATSQLVYTRMVCQANCSSGWRRKARRFPGSWILSQQPCLWRCNTASHCGSYATSSATRGLSRAGGRAIQRLATPSR